MITILMKHRYYTMLYVDIYIISYRYTVCHTGLSDVCPRPTTPSPRCHFMLTTPVLHCSTLCNSTIIIHVV